MWLTAWAGAVSGITLSYYIGRTLGMGFIHKYGKYIHVTPEKMDKVRVWFDKLGHWVLVIGYYIAGVRHFSAMVAGTSGLTYPHFAVFAYGGALIWVELGRDLECRLSREVVGCLFDSYARQRRP